MVANTHTQKKNKKQDTFCLGLSAATEGIQARKIKHWLYTVGILMYVVRFVHEFHSPWIIRCNHGAWSWNPKHLELLVAITMPFEAARFGEKASCSRKELKHFHQTMP